MTSAEIAFYTELLAQRDHELSETQSSFNKYKLKQKVKLDQLKKDVAMYCSRNGIHISDHENCALLAIRLAESDNAYEESRRHAEQLNQELNRRQMQLNDHIIRIKNLEEQLRAASPLNPAEVEERRRAAQHVDMDRVHQQMMYKDERIVELNNMILDKERQILDLQETCREQGEVASVKTQAMRIVQKKFEDLEKSRREVGTETDSWLWTAAPAARSRNERGGEGAGGGPGRSSNRSLSPGHAIASRASGSGGTGSPPPLDPSEAENRLTAEREDDDDLPGTSKRFQGKNLDDEASLQRKQRKRVTFDLPPSATTSTVDLNNATADEELTNALFLLSGEKEQLQQELDEQTKTMEQYKIRIDMNDSELARVVREGKNASLKARAVAQARIRELEDRMAELSQQCRLQADQLQTENETLRSTRDWEVEQNGQLREEVARIRERTHKLTEELDASEKSNRDLDNKVYQSQALVEQLIDELAEAEAIVVMMEDEKHSILDDVDRLKDAIRAQDKLIEVLDADVVIYEEHIGILRESLGASKVDHRSLIRSKAFETKLKALEQEKEQINMKSHEDRLRTKALSQKVKELTDENERLMEKLCDKEMGAVDDEDMAETCRQLEAKIKEADEKMQAERADYELRVQTARLEAERKAQEAASLLASLQEARNQLNGRASPSGHGNIPSIPPYPPLSRRSPNRDHHHQQQQQTVLPSPNHEEMTAKLQTLQNDYDDQAKTLQHLRGLVSQLNEQIDGLQGHNFELGEQVQELRQVEEDYDVLVEKHREVAAELVHIKEQSEEREKESTNEEVSNLRAVLEEITEEKSALRTELEHARMNLSETNAVKLELEQLKKELEQERANGRAQWDDVCRKLLDGENSEAGASRKNSMEVSREVQNQQYIVAFEEKIDQLQKELQKANEKCESDRLEKRKLKAAVRKLRAEAQDQQQSQSVQSESATSVGETTAPAPLDTVSVVPLGTAAEAVTSTTSVDTVSEAERVKNLEMECRLSGELNVEIGRAMLELENQIESYQQQAAQAQENSHRVTMELRLHEMLQEEMGRELDQLKIKEADLELKLTESRSELAEKTAMVQHLQAEVEMQQQMGGSDAIENVQIEFARVSFELQETRERLQLVEHEKQRSAEAREEEIIQLRQSLTETASQLEQSRAAARQLEAELASQRGAAEQAKQELLATRAEERKSHATQESSLLQATAATTDLVTQLRTSENNAEYLSLAVDPRETPVVSSTPPSTDLESENLILRQCVQDSVQMQDDMSQDVAKLLELKMELETAVEALKGDIWTLNGQLKASVLDRENLQDRVVALDTSLTAEKKRADGLDGELAEQVELTEKATRQAAEAENESNRRLAECLDMETRREELEKAYVQLTDYYGQLQTAYNALYAKVHHAPAAPNETDVDAVEPEVQLIQQSALQQSSSGANFQVAKDDSEILAIVDAILGELKIEVAVGADLRIKLDLIHSTMKLRMAEIEESRRAVAEQHRVNETLSNQLSALEEETQREAGESQTTRQRLLQLEGDLEWKQDECDSLQRRIDELQRAIDAVVERGSEPDAARLATRQADVDSLFRTNAELAHTNVELQNELDEQREREGEEMVETGADDESTREQIQAEINSLRESESTLRRRVGELEERLAESSQKEEEMKDGDQWDWEHRVEETPATKAALQCVKMQSRIDELEIALRDSEQLSEEVNRLSGIEDVLNNRILSLEDQLLEKEEGLQELEEQLMERQRDLDEARERGEEEREQTARQPTVAVDSQTDVVEFASDESREELLNQLELARAELSLVRALLAKTEKLAEEREAEVEEKEGEIERMRLEQQQNKPRADSWGWGESEQEKEDGDEVVRLRAELDEVRLKLEQQKQKKEEEPEEEGWGWGASDEKKKTESDEIERLTRELEQVAQERDNLAEKLTSREAEAEAEAVEDPDNWGWNDESAVSASQASKELDEIRVVIGDITRERDRLRLELEEVRRGREEQQEQGGDSAWGWGDQEARESAADDAVEKLEKESERLAEELEEKRLKEQELTERLEQVELELEQLRQRVEELEEAESRNAREIERLIGELEQCHVREKELREELEATIKEAQVVHPETDHRDEAADAWGEDWADQTQDDEESPIEEERQLRADAEQLAEALKDVVAKLRDQVADLQQQIHDAPTQEEVNHLNSEVSRLTAELAEAQASLTELRAEAASRAEAWGWEEQANQNQLDQTREDAVRLREELDSAESERRRLTEELFASQQRADELADQLQLKHESDEERNGQLEDAQSKLQALECEHDAMQTRLVEADAVIVSLKQEISVLESTRLQMEDIQRSADEIGVLEAKLTEFQVQLSTIQNRMGGVERQNALLQESEARLLESVDRYSQLAEKRGAEVELLEEKMVEQRKEVEHLIKEKRRLQTEIAQSKLTKRSTPAASDKDQTELKRQIAELEQRLQETESRLNVVEQEKTKVKAAYDHLRARLTARRQTAAAASRDASRRSSAVTLDGEIPEEPTAQKVTVAVPSHYVETSPSTSNQAADKDIVRRRVAKN